MENAASKIDTTAPRVLVVTKPLVPPWRDGTKVLVRELVETAGHTRFVIPIPKGTPPPWNHVETWTPFGRTNGTGLKGKALLFGNLLRKPATDIIHFFFAPNPASSLAGRLAVTNSSQPTVQTVCSVPKSLKGLKWLTFSDHLVVLSQFTRKLFERAGIPSERITVIHPGIRPMDRAPAPRLAEIRRRFGLDSGPSILFAGDYDFSDAARIMLEAAVILARKRSDLRVIFTVRLKTEASMHMEQRLKAKVAREGLTGRISFYNEVDDFHGLLEAVDLSLLPAETTYAKTDFPYVLLESMALGTPVIVADDGPLPELVAKGGGLTVPTGDPQALALTADDLLSDRKRLERLGSEARSVVARHFSAETMVARYEALYKSLADTQRGRR